MNCNHQQSLLNGETPAEATPCDPDSNSFSDQTEVLENLTMTWLPDAPVAFPESLRISNSSISALSESETEETSVPVVETVAISEAHHQSTERISTADGTFNALDAVVLIFSIVCYAADLITDISTAIDHLMKGNYLYSALTLALVIIPGWTMSFISWRWEKNMSVFNLYLSSRDPWARSKTRFIFEWTFHWILPASPIVRYVRTLRYGLKSRPERNKEQDDEQFENHDCWKNENSCTSFLRLFESFMEAAPQLVLQLYIVAVEAPGQRPSIIQMVSIAVSGVSLIWGLTSLSRSMRSSVIFDVVHSYRAYIFPHKTDLRGLRWYHFILADVALFLAHLLNLFARISALVLFASAFRYWSLGIILTHWALMAYSLVRVRKPDWRTRNWNRSNCYYDRSFFLWLSYLPMAFVYIFTYVKYYSMRWIEVIHSSYEFRNLFWNPLYFLVCFVENSLMMGLWWLKTAKVFESRNGSGGTDQRPPWYQMAIVFGQPATFILGIVLLAFYQQLYPSRLKDYLKIKPISIVPEWKSCVSQCYSIYNLKYGFE